MRSSSDSGLPAVRRRLRAPRTSEILLDLARTFERERLSLRGIAELLGNRSFGLLLLIFALPNTLPLGIPGLSTLTGIPLAFVALQMVFGMPRPYLPRWLGERSVRREDFRNMIERTAPWLQKVERAMRPRWLALTGIAGERALGTFCLLLALVLVLPIPFGNLLPGIAVALIALGLIEKDGLLVTAGAVVGAAGVALASGLLWAMVQGALAFFGRLLGG